MVNVSRVVLIVLLIVPYGIETNERKVRDYWEYLLIVPYGIETRYQQKDECDLTLLIVPYGIETCEAAKLEVMCPPFNRTIWN